MIKRTIELPFGVASLRSDDVLTFKPIDSKTISVAELQQMLDAFCEITDGERKKYLSDNREYEFFGFAERKFIGNHLHEFALAAAIIENNPVIRFIGHTINSFFTPKVPMQMFKSEEEALEWLKSGDFQ